MARGGKVGGTPGIAGARARRPGAPSSASFLTLLGIMIGVTTIIVIGAVINGLNSNVLGQVQSLGSSTVICYRFSWATLGRLPAEVLQRKELKAEWADGMARLPHVVAAAPLDIRSQFRIRIEHRAPRQLSIVRMSFCRAIHPPLRKSAIFRLARGRFLNDTDEVHRSAVVVLGSDTAKTLFPNQEDPIGQDGPGSKGRYSRHWSFGKQKQALGTVRIPTTTSRLFRLGTMRRLHPEFQRLHAVRQGPTRPGKSSDCRGRSPRIPGDACASCRRTRTMISQS